MKCSGSSSPLQNLVLFLLLYNYILAKHEYQPTTIEPKIKVQIHHVISSMHLDTRAKPGTSASYMYRCVLVMLSIYLLFT